MSSKTKISESTVRLTITAVLCAIIIIMSFTPLGFLRVGLIEITFLTIPVAIGANLCGYKSGLILGAVFGVCSFITGFFDAFGLTFINVNPFFYFLLCIPTRVLAGFLSGLLSGIIARGNRHAAYILSSLCAAVFNTLFFVGTLVLLYGHNNEILEYFGATNIWGIVVAIVTANSTIEVIATGIVGTAVSEAVYAASKKM